MVKTYFKYVCVVQTINDDDGDIVVMGLKKTDDIRTEFSIDDKDILTIYAEMIQAIVSSPKLIIK